MNAIVTGRRFGRLEKPHQNLLMEGAMAAYRVGPFELQQLRLILTCNGKAVPLGRKVVETLLTLAERAGEPVSKQILIERLWPGAAAGDAKLAQNVYVLRKIFCERGIRNAVATVPGFGYRLSVPVEFVDSTAVSIRRGEPPLALRCAAIAGACMVFTISALVAPLATGPFAPAPRAVLTRDDARLYTLGRYYWNLRTADGVGKSLHYFQRIVEREPENPLGYVGMADANVTMGDYCYGAHRPADYFRRARAFLDTALLLDPDSVAARATQGFLLLHEGAAAAAVTELRRAVTSDPSYAPAREWYGIALARQNRLADARVQLRDAAELAPLSVAATAWLGSIAGRSGEVEDRRVYARELRDMLFDAAPATHRRGHPMWASIEASAETAIFNE
jgi:DNA-binding winged helix-turn-helix (wHTH) protein